MNKKTIGTATLALVLVALGVAGTTQAYRGDPTVKGPNYTAERHTAMEHAFDNKDYTTWATLMQGRGRVTQLINKDNFTKFVEAHELALQGKTTEAQKLRAELGLGLQNEGGRGMGMGMGRFQNK